MTVSSRDSLGASESINCWPISRNECAGAVRTTSEWLLPISIPSLNLIFGFDATRRRSSVREPLIIRLTIKSGTYEGTATRRVPFGATEARILRDRALRRTVIWPNSSSLTTGMAYYRMIIWPRVGARRSLVGCIAVRGAESFLRTALACVANVCFPLITNAFSVACG